MNILAIFGHALQAISVGQQALQVVGRVHDVLQRMSDENREEPTIEELDEIAGRISSRQDHINQM